MSVKKKGLCDGDDVGGGGLLEPAATETSLANIANI